MLKKLTLISLIPSVVFAQEECKCKEDNKDKEKPQEFSLSLGYVQTTGNSETNTINLKSDYKYKFDSKRIYFNLNGIYGTSKGEKTAEEISGNLRLEKRYLPYFVFWDINYYRNPFQSYEHSVKTGPGLGIYLYESKKAKLSLAYYLYYVYNKLNAPSPFSNTDEEKYYLHNIEERFKIKFTKNLKLKQKLIYKLTSRKMQDYFVYFESSLINALTKHLALEIDYVATYQNIPIEADIKRLDTKFSTLIQYSF
ncbi:DUF481 domain-containing protein [Hydrogenothermus marinus]|uniref:Uncharacterized protein DUF481 n=1 Tax=Hydrogenothermus marinus TaxID=133270 RepID=A0A3M0BDU4_9AQUI|nr:DUF481 domain-containing protein [Hydrogenothermus marinus]RMA93128.1 uncharacterized protein DUF481 [Hydrogenothermus marinus]